MTATVATPEKQAVPAKRVPWGRYAGIAVVAAVLLAYPLVVKTSFLQTIGVLALTMAIASTAVRMLVLVAALSAAPSRMSTSSTSAALSAASATMSA